MLEDIWYRHRRFCGLRWAAVYASESALLELDGTAFFQRVWLISLGEF